MQAIYGKDPSVSVHEKEISDTSIHGLRAVEISFYVPAVRGDGFVRFANNYGPKMIREVVFVFPTGDELKFDRDYIISYANYLQSKNKTAADIMMKNDEARFSMRRGVNYQTTIHEHSVVTVAIPTVFDITTTNHLPLWREKGFAHPKVRVVFESLDKVLTYQKDANFCFVGQRPSFPDNVCLVYEALHGPYSIDKPVYIPFVTEICREVSFGTEHMKSITDSNFKSVANISFFERPPKTTADKTVLVSFPNGQAPSPSDYMKSYIDAIISDLVVFATPKQLSELYPNLSVFVPVKNNMAFSRNRDGLWSVNCKVFVENLPENDERKLYYHANLFSYKGYDTTNPPLPPTNVSNHFSLVRGTFLKSENRIAFGEVEHTLPEYFPALPVSVWQSPNNCTDFAATEVEEDTVVVSRSWDSIGDKRRKESRSNDLVFNDPELIGFGFCGQNLLQVMLVDICQQIKYDNDSLERLRVSSTLMLQDPRALRHAGRHARQILQEHPVQHIIQQLAVRARGADQADRSGEEGQEGHHLRHQPADD